MIFGFHPKIFSTRQKNSSHGKIFFSDDRDAHDSSNDEKYQAEDVHEVMSND